MVNTTLAQQMATLQANLESAGNLKGLPALEMFAMAREMLGQMRGLIDSAESTLNDAETNELSKLAK